MTRRALTTFPRGTGYEYGDAQHLPIVPLIEETPTVTSPSENATSALPGDEAKKEINHE